MAAKRPALNLLAGVLLIWLVASPVASQPVPPAQNEANFKAGFYNGCMRSKQRRGVEERYARASCLCAVLEFQAAMSEDEFREVVASASKGEAAMFDLPQFARGMSGQMECEKVGTYDDAFSDAPEIALLSPRRFERFSIRLPQGFIASPAPAELAGRAYYFFRVHADLETTTVLAVGILPATMDTNLGSTADGDRLLAMVVEFLRRQGVANLVHRAVADQSIGTLTFKATQWTGSIHGRESEGVVYVARVRDAIVVLTANDVKSHIAGTLPIMQASMKTFLFYGDSR